MVRVRVKKGVNIMAVGKKIVVSLLALWVSGFLVQIVSHTMLGYCSPFFQGLSLFGWKVGNNATASAGGVTPDTVCTDVSSNYILYDVSNAGILIIVGIIGMASVVMEFVNVSW